LDDLNYLTGFISTATKAHGYPIQWYIETIPKTGNGPLSGFGWGYSLEWSLLKPDQYAFPPSAVSSAQPGKIWWQQWGDADDHKLEVTEPATAQVPPAVTGLLAAIGRAEVQSVDAIVQTAEKAAASLAGFLDNTVDWVGTQVQAGVAWSAGAARTVGNVTVQMVDDVSANLAQDVNWAEQQAQEGVNTVLDLFPHQNISATLTTSPPEQPGPLHRIPLVAQPPTGNTPAYLWLPIIVPAQAQWMAFDFAISGDGQQDAIVFGVNGTNLFTLAAQFIPRTEAQTSSPIDMTACAGKTNELFSGIVGGTSTNCTITIQNIRFYSLQRPRLEIMQAGLTLVLSWATIANGYILETTGSLKANAWQPTTNAPAIVADHCTITTASTEQTRFFRLRRR
jgi:hypothetical protein